ncbi:hypothetical protein D3C75_1301570 [compost metagenome]
MLDEDELEEALARKQITTADYDLANRTAKELLRAIDAHMFPYFQLSLKHRKSLFENGEFRKNVQL